MVSPLISFRCPPTLLEQIDEQAEAEHRTRSNLVQLAVHTYIERTQHGKPRQGTQEAA